MTQPSYQTITGGFPLGHHLEMILDAPRVAAICQAVDRCACASKSFLELGPGSGLFLEHARRKFAEVVGVEKDPVVLDVARKTLASPGPSNWKLLEGDSRQVSLDGRYDVILCEMLSTWCIVEPQVSVIRDALKRHAAVGANIIPARVINLIEVGFAPFGFGPVQVPTPYLTLTGVRSPVIMSQSRVAHTIDLAAGIGLEDEITGSIEFEMLVGGHINCVRLTSLVELAPGINWYSSDTLMPPMVYPLRESAGVFAGQKMVVGYSCRYGAGLEGSEFWAKR